MLSVDILLAIVVPLGIWAMVLVFVLAILLAVSDGIQRLRRLHQVPCFRCQYYTNSPYLKCPVRPLDAGSEAALCCADYQPADFIKLASASARCIPGQYYGPYPGRACRHTSHAKQPHSCEIFNPSR